MREMYYVSEGWDVGFDNQQESNNITEDIEVTLGVSRENLGLLPEEDGASVYGDITLRDDDVEFNAKNLENQVIPFLQRLMMLNLLIQM